MEADGGLLTAAGQPDRGFIRSFGVEWLELEFTADDNGEHERLRYKERPATNFHGFLTRQTQRLFA